MFWQGRRESDNVEDQRSMSKTTMAVAGGGIGVILLGLVVALLGGDPGALFRQGQEDPQQDAQQAGPQKDPAQEQLVKFVKVVLADTEDVWDAQFQKMGRTYRKPKLVLFSGRVKSACGLADSAVGPFYCPGDEHVYLDLTFFEELKKRFKAPGEFAQAYVIAHEIGHHVQKQLGYSDRVRTRKGRESDSVKLELQADYLAGVWAYHADKTKHILEPGDLEAALKAAFEIGDDRLQKQSRGYVVPDSFTHGSSEQRVRYFRKGFDTGDASKEALDFFFEADEL
jgi:predicted metalloprotease